MLGFCLLSLISGILETGAVIYTLSVGGVGMALLAALSYQLGNLVPSPVALSRNATIVIALAAVVLFAACTIWAYNPLILLAMLLASVALQSVRGCMKANIPKALKRSLRIIGFAAGFFFSPFIGAICAAVAVLSAACARFPEPAIFKLKLNMLSAVMILHQMHYFVYCYAVLIIAYQTGGATIAILLFVAGWITYVFSPPLYRRGHYEAMFLAGHSMLVALLLGIFFVRPLYVKAILWILTGVGGTTEFCIGRLEGEHGIYSDRNHGAAENIGHCLGVAGCIVIFAVTKNLSYLPLFAAVFAALAITVMLAFLRRRASL